MSRSQLILSLVSINDCMFALELFCLWQERLRFLSNYLKSMKMMTMTMSFTPVMKAVMMIISVLKQVKVKPNVFRTASVG